MKSKNIIRKVILFLIGISASTILTAGSNFVNVKEFGAKGDGKTDDSNSIQSAIDSIQTSGGTVFFPEGRYTIKKTILINGQPTTKNEDYGWITLRGTGGGSFLLGDGVDYIIAARRNPNSEVSYINGLRVKELSFSSFDTKMRCGGINVSYMLRWYIQDCNFLILKKGIYSDGGRDANGKSKSIWICRILNNIFSRNADWPIEIGRCFDLVIANNVIEHSNGGICAGKPGDKYDAAANTIRIENNVIEGAQQNPAILGSCWIGGRIVGNYFEGNHGGDIMLTPGENDGWTRGMVIASNTFQPTEKQRKDGIYGPLYLQKIRDAVVYGNVTTGVNLFHKESAQWGSGMNIYSNTTNNPASVGTLEGATDKERVEYLKNLPGYGTPRFSMYDIAGEVGLDAQRGFTYNGKSIRFGTSAPQATPVENKKGDIVFNQAPECKDGKITLGWICLENGKPGKWTPIMISANKDK